MKQIFVLLFAVILASGSVNAQKYYARLGVGIGFGLSYYDGRTADRTISGNTSDVSEIRSGSLGTGVNINLAGGYMFSKFVGIDLGFNEFIGFGAKTSYNLTGSGISQVYDDKYSAKSFQIIPALVVTPGFEKLNPYGRFGVILGVATHTNYSYTNTKTGFSTGKATAATTVENYKDKDSGGLAIGIAAAIGADYSLNDKLSVYAEVNMNGINYSPTKGKVVEWTKDGVDQIPLSTTKDLEWEYVKTLDNKENIASSSPNKYLKESAILTNVGISIGARFRFGGK